MTRIVINARYGGFSMSKEAVAMYQKRAGKEVKLSSVFYTDPVLVQVVETLGKRANGAHSQLHIVDVPDDVDWEIDSSLKAFKFVDTL